MAQSEGSAAAKAQAPPIGPFSMTDEERDIAQFSAYVTTLAPDCLWDILSHLDEDRYPRRHEAVLREMARRRLFFVVPYTQRELRLRAFLLTSVFLAALALLLSIVGSFTIEASLHIRLPFFTDLAVGSPKAARLLLPMVLPLACIAAAGTILATLYALCLLTRRRIRRDIAAMGVMATLAILLLLCLATR